MQESMKPSHAFARAVLGLLLILFCQSALATTWYVRTDGGTRYSAGAHDGQCDGRSDAAYSGKGKNEHCAYKDVRSLWTDGTYCTDDSAASKCWKWVGEGGDTYILRGSMADGSSYRIGQNGPTDKDYFGLAGNPYGAGAPPPPSGMEAAHTRVLGGNYASCSAPSARTQVHGGYAVGAVLNMSGASYVDVACLDITDFSSCGRSAQANACNTSSPLSDFAGSGIQWSNTSTHDTLTDVRVHGMAALGMLGPTGDGVVMTRLELVGNAGAGWNADAGDGKTGTGKVLVQDFNISWNGCAEEYPVKDPLPYGDCTDDNGGGYGDGFGTATVASNPGWQVHFDQGVASYNTQDGLDALHLVGNSSSMTITHVLAYGNMGQQIKVGGTAGTATGNTIYTSCNAMRQPIPGVPTGYNKKLSDFCRAADAGVVFSVGDGTTTTFSDNTVYSASATAVEVVVGDKCTTSTCLVRQQHNIFIGFKNDAADGYPDGGKGDFSNPLYVEEAEAAYRNPGSSFDHNTTFHAKSNWHCPAVQLHEKDAYCGDPHLVDESWHVYGYGDAKLTRPIPFKASDAAGEGDHRPRRVMLASLGCLVLFTGGAIGWRRRSSRPIM